jgi:hypothetical protein
MGLDLKVNLWVIINKVSKVLERQCFSNIINMVFVYGMIPFIIHNDLWFLVNEIMSFCPRSYGSIKGWKHGLYAMN